MVETRDKIENLSVRTKLQWMRLLVSLIVRGENELGTLLAVANCWWIVLNDTRYECARLPFAGWYQKCMLLSRSF